MIIFPATSSSVETESPLWSDKLEECRRSRDIHSNEMLALLCLEGLQISSEFTVAVHLFLSRF